MSAPDTKSSTTSNLGRDFISSLVVFLVALPLCMGIAVASGMSPQSGLITGIIGGIVVGSLAGSPLQVSGPAAGLAVLVFEIVREQGVATLGIIVVLAGALQILAGAARVGHWFRSISPAIVHGMLAGIGLLIVASQLHVLLDRTPLPNGLSNLAAVPGAFVDMSPTSAGQTEWAFALGAITIIAFLGWEKFRPKALKLVPGALIGVVVSTAIAVALRPDVKRVIVPPSLLDGVKMPVLADFTAALSNPEIIISAIVIAFIASAETLLSAAAVDRMHDGPRTKYNKELFSQGVGNMLCGFLGGLPMTGVIVRSSANVEAGAKSRLSAVFHGAWLLLLVVAIPGLLGNIPTASLAAVLVFTGLKLVDIKAARELAKYGKSEALIFIATCVMIVVTDLLTGVLVGIGLSIAKLLYVFTHLKIEVKDDAAVNRTDLHLTGAATFLRLPKIAAVLETVRPNTTLHVHLDRLTYVDHACLDLFMNWEQQHDATGGALVMDWASFTAKFQGPPEGQSETGRSASERTLAHSGTPAAAHAELLPEPAVTSARAP